MQISQVEGVMNNLSDVSNAGLRQTRRIMNIFKLMKLSIIEHDMMMSVPEYVENYKAFLGQEGLDDAILTRNNFEMGLNMFIESGIITVEDINKMIAT